MGWDWLNASFFRLRLEKFNLIPQTATMVSQQAAAMRRYRFTLLDDEPLPPTAWMVYVCICCLRVTTFYDQPIYGNDQASLWVGEYFFFLESGNNY